MKRFLTIILFIISFLIIICDNTLFLLKLISILYMYIIAYKNNYFYQGDF